MPEHHSPLPWGLGDLGGVVVAGENAIANCYVGRDTDNEEANAAFIVRCVNSHEALVEALRESRKHVAASAEAIHLLDGFGPRTEQAEDRLLQTVDAALALAEGA